MSDYYEGGEPQTNEDGTPVYEAIEYAVVDDGGEFVAYEEGTQAYTNADYTAGGPGINWAGSQLAVGQAWALYGAQVIPGQNFSVQRALLGSYWSPNAAKQAVHTYLAAGTAKGLLATVCAYQFNPSQLAPPQLESSNSVRRNFAYMGCADNQLALGQAALSGYGATNTAGGEGNADALGNHQFWDNASGVHVGVLVAGQNINPLDSMTWPKGTQTTDVATGHVYELVRPEDATTLATWIPMTRASTAAASAAAVSGAQRPQRPRQDPSAGVRARAEAQRRGQEQRAARVTTHRAPEPAHDRGPSERRAHAAQIRARDARPAHEVQAAAALTIAPPYSVTGDVTWELQIADGRAFKVGSDGSRFDLGQWLGSNRVLFDGNYYSVDSLGNAVLLGSASVATVGPMYAPPPPPEPYYPQYTEQQAPYYPPPPPQYGPPPGYYPQTIVPPMAPDPHNAELAAWIGQAVYEGTIGAAQAQQPQQNLAVGPISFMQGDPFYNELMYG